MTHLTILTAKIESAITAMQNVASTTEPTVISSPQYFEASSNKVLQDMSTSTTTKAPTTTTTLSSLFPKMVTTKAVVAKANYFLILFDVFIGKENIK